jgi:hypothetical protein
MADVYILAKINRRGETEIKGIFTQESAAKQVRNTLLRQLRLDAATLGEAPGYDIQLFSAPTDKLLGKLEPLQL